ncbi:EamA family transporter [Sphingobacterium yanglingense]|uniref:Threonine/homoserine efflux transporter RhtA n=1 Tax=Sphingobacterium yanglingense TaxID=1437280 RepID=A0A4R6WAE6_9SPHI|nr:DMT family transporter [Sphingobacterium yanglingense]TDQ76349.1 threonine/homoserine efflux transporter RhtA [Sphingobacterium yanglingense]
MNKYVLIVALGALSYGMLSSFAKIAYGQGYSAAEVTFIQGFIGALILWSASFVRKARDRKKKSDMPAVGRWKLLLAGACMGVATYLYYLSVQYITASLAIVLLMQMAWMSIFAEWIVLRRRPHLKQLGAAAFILFSTFLAGGFTGVTARDFSLLGIALALSSAVLYSFYILFTSELGKDIHVFEKSALMTTGSTVIIFLINCNSLYHSVHIDSGLLQWGLFLAIFGTVIPPICFSVGMPKLGPGLSAILLTLELPAAVLCAFLVLNEQITMIQLLGIVLLFLALLYINLSLKGAKGEKLDLQYSKVQK